jgi:hypothetical protein
MFAGSFTDDLVNKKPAEKTSTVHWLLNGLLTNLQDYMDNYKYKLSKSLDVYILTKSPAVSHTELCKFYCSLKILFLNAFP